MGNKGSKTSLHSSFTWKLPKLTPLHIDLLCNGFITRSISKLMPTDVINLCIQYFNDDVEIESIKNAKNSACYKSNIFSINQFKFYMDLYPNGFEPTNIGYVDVLLNILSIPPTIDSVKVKYSISLQETHTNSKNSSTFDRQNIGYLWNQKLRLNKIKSLQTLTFVLIIKKVKIYYSNENTEEMPQNKINIQTDLILPKSSYTWNINNNQIKTRKNNLDLLKSEIFPIGGFKWMLEICKMSDGLDGVILSLLALSSNICSVCIYFEMGLHENEDIVKHGWTEFHFVNLYHIICPHLDFDNINIYRVWITICILDIFDEDGNSLSNIDLFQNDSLSNICQSKYEWKIEENSLLSKIKTCKPGQMFVSPCFEFFACLWCLRFYPNGYDINVADTGMDNCICLMLNLIATPPHIESISLVFETMLAEVQSTKSLEHQRFERDSFWGSEHKNIDILVLDKLTIECIVSVIDVYDQNGKAINNSNALANVKEMKMNSMQFIWNISDDIDAMKNIKQRKNEFIVMSPIFVMFSFKWYMEIHSIYYDENDGDEEGNEDTFIVFLSLATKSPNVQSLSFGFEIIVKETNDFHSNYGQLFGEELSIGIQAISPKRHVLNALNTLTFVLDLSLIHVFDKNGMNLMNQHEEKYNELEAKQIDYIYQDYEWKIEENKLMKKLKKAKHFESFSSDIFVINGFKFMMQICPNGSHLENVGEFNWFLSLVSIPPSIFKVAVIYKISLLECGVSDNYRMELSMKCTSYGWNRKNIKFSHISKIKQLTFKLQIAIIDVYDIDGHIVANTINSMNSSCKPIINHPYLLASYRWKVSEKELVQSMKMAKNGESFKSPQFGDNIFKWNLLFYPNGINKKNKGECILSLCLPSLPNNVSGISIYFEESVKETATIWSYYTNFRKDKLSEGWETCRIKTKDIMNLKRLTLSVTVSLIDVYDMESNIVTDKYRVFLQ